jgi:metal-responsive CopG/Arc/MetJ family transcriptional regulator
MKTAISIPDDVFARVDEFAKRRKMSRSALFTVAVDQYVQQHRADDVTHRLNEIYAREDSTLDPVFERLQRHALPREDW